MPDHPLRALVLIAALLSVAVPCAARGPAAAAVELDLDAFIRELDSLAARTASVTPEDAAALRAELPPSWRVRFGTGHVDVSSRWILAALHEARRDAASWPTKRQQLAARITAARAEAAALRQAPSPAHDDRASAVLASVLARAEFQRSVTSLWMERLRNRVVSWVAELFERLGGRGPSRRTLAIALAWVLGLGALAVLSLWLVRLIVGAAAAHPLGIAHAKQ